MHGLACQLVPFEVCKRLLLGINRLVASARSNRHPFRAVSPHRQCGLLSNQDKHRWKKKIYRSVEINRPGSVDSIIGCPASNQALPAPVTIAASHLTVRKLEVLLTSGDSPRGRDHRERPITHSRRSKSSTNCRRRRPSPRALCRCQMVPLGSRFDDGSERGRPQNCSTSAACQVHTGKYQTC
ncbi:hypothetical protein GGD68_002331 [Paraburkholderia fungorum]|uniref:Uncharacterized protein n=1 Tax=Paraburkholderia fungorum TaxID=134537 RepID=A0AAW3USY5_9BURK|nr:hypothetical protein [Paraburkholderia fungorum]MBB6200811.1 hypothetical protein [Paraburkholderia fungorum]